MVFSGWFLQISKFLSLAILKYIILVYCNDLQFPWYTFLKLNEAINVSFWNLAIQDLHRNSRFARADMFEKRLSRRFCELFESSSRGVTRSLEKKIERVPQLVFEATGPLFSPRIHDTVWYEGWDWLQLQNSLIKYNHVRSLSNTDYHLFFLTVLITVTGLATMVYLLLGGTQGMMVRITWTLKGKEIASGGLWRSLIIFLEIRTF